jgi:hypothetical protein
MHAYNPPQCRVGRLMQTRTSLRHSPLFERTLLDTHSQVAAAEVGNVNHSHLREPLETCSVRA